MDLGYIPSPSMNSLTTAGLNLDSNKQTAGRTTMGLYIVGTGNY